MEPSPDRRRIAPRVVRILLILVCLLGLFAYSGISLYSADLLTRPHNRHLRYSARAISADAVSWSTRTSDGLTLRGWYLPSPARERLIVLVHGLWSSRDDMASLGRDLHQLGYNVLMFDLRGHGQSDSSRVYMGRHERNDIRAVLDWAERAGFEPDRIGWVGYSMGASTLLMEAARNARIRVAVIDSPYGNLPELLDSQLTRYSNLPSLFNPGILLAARLAFGVRTDDLVPIRFARAWGDRPILLIHGSADTTVPIAQARQMAQSLGPSCMPVYVHGVEHNQAYLQKPEDYVALLDSFFEIHLQ